MCSNNDRESDYKHINITDIVQMYNAKISKLKLATTKETDALDIQKTCFVDPCSGLPGNQNISGNKFVIGINNKSK